MSRITKKSYEEHLNEIGPPQGDAQWIIGGKIRMIHMWQKKYGTAIRKYDPIGFRLGFNEFKLRNEQTKI